MDIEYLDELYDENKHYEIVEEFELYDYEDLNYELKIHLARAYNNTKSFDEAIEILFTEYNVGINDPYWNFILGYAYYFNENFQLALKYFERSSYLSNLKNTKLKNYQKDLKNYILKCHQIIKSNSKKNDLKEIALKYKKFGFNISCVTNKRNLYNSEFSSIMKTPSHNWKNLSYKHQKRKEWENYDWENAVGIGCFPYWNDIVVINIEGCNDLEFLKEILSCLNLPQDYEWVIKTGSNNGYHIYYEGYKNEDFIDEGKVNTYYPKKEFEKYFDKIEFLWEAHIILPPSFHESGFKYSFLNCDFPKESPKTIDSYYTRITKYLDVEIDNDYDDFSDWYSITSNKDNYNIFNNVFYGKYLNEPLHLILDLETTDLIKKENEKIIYPEVLQIAWALTTKKGIIIKKKSYIINTPKLELLKSPPLSEIVNIDYESAIKVSVDLEIALEELLLDSKLSETVVAHNIDFDIKILENIYYKNYQYSPFKRLRKICTMKSSVDFCKIPHHYGYKYPKLSELYYTLFGQSITNSHNAYVDVSHTLKCFVKLYEIGFIE